MNRLIALLDSEFCGNLLTALMHSLWQAVVIAGFLLLFLKNKTAKDANVRYIAALIALTAIVLCGLFTWAVLDYEPSVANETLVTDSLSPERTASAVVQAENNDKSILTKQKSIESDISSEVLAKFNWQISMMCLWLIGVMGMLLRTLCVVVGGDRLRRQCRALEDEHILALVEQLRRSIGITRRIRVAAGENISVPGVVGCIWPTLLLPISMVSGIPTDDLRAILAHELAHIRRYDYLVNFCQMVTEAILFFNPAVWWISRQIRIEREACCDAAGIIATGQRIRYAEVLANLAKRLKGTNVTVVPTTIGFGRAGDSSGMLERVRRIVVAGHRPRLRVSWYIATATLILSLALLVGLWRGTNLAVVLAGRILSPQERIEKITEISKEYGFEDREYSEEDKIHLSGITITYDGRSLPKDASITVHSKRPGHGTSKTISTSKSGHFREEGSFKCRVEFGRVFVVARANGYAPVFAGPFEAEPGGSIDGIKLVLEQGFIGRIQVLDEDDKPVSNAEITGGYRYTDGSYHHTIKIATDEDGIATVEHAAPWELALQIEADGFEQEKTEGIVFDPNKTAVVRLKETKAASGVVVSRATSEPIDGAEIRVMMSKHGNHSYGGNGMHYDPEAITNEAGQFALTMLRSDRQYLLLVRAENYGRQYISNVGAGDCDIKITLGPKKVIRGRIVGNLERLSKHEYETPVVSYWQNYRLGNHSASVVKGWSPVTIKDGVGYFEIDECWGQSVRIRAGGKLVSVNIEEDSLGDVVIELMAEDSELREVVLRFQAPPDSPPVQGGVRIDYITERAREEKRGMTPDWLDIVNGLAHCKIPVPGRFKYGIDCYKGKRPIGYWFKEIREIDVAVSVEPLVINVPVHPAGMIYGRILRPDGSIAEDASASLIVNKKPEIAKGLYDLISTIHGGGLDKGKFNASPLPLGGEYVIVAYERNSFVVIEPIILTEKNPIQEQDIQLVEGITLSGRLLDIDGTATRNFLRLGVSVECGDHSWGTKRKEIRPDENGRFSFENINPNFQGNYEMYGSVGPGYRPIRRKIKDVCKPVKIQLEQGQVVKGVLLDDETGWPIPGADVYGYCHQKKNGKFQYEKLHAESETNERGEFIFSNMAKRQYNIGVSGANIANRREQVMAIGGQKEPVIIRVKINKWSNLKPHKPMGEDN